MLLASTLFCSLLPPGCPPCRNPKLSVGSWMWQLSHLRHCFKQQPAHLHSLRICFGATLSFRAIGNIMLRYLVGGLIDENLQPINLTSSWRLSILIWPLASCSNQFPCSCCGVTMGFPRQVGRRKYLNTWNMVQILFQVGHVNILFSAVTFNYAAIHWVWGLSWLDTYFLN